MSYYTRTFDVLPASSNLSQQVEDEFELIEAGFAQAENNRTIDLAAFSSALALKAPLASPALSGVPTVPTPAVSDNSTTVANTAFVQNVLGAGGALLPPQTGHADEFLKTDGTVASWSPVAGAIAWSGISAKPTTLAGFGITNAQHALEFADGAGLKAVAPMRVTFSSGITVARRGDGIVIDAGPGFPHHLLLAQGII